MSGNHLHQQRYVSHYIPPPLSLLLGAAQTIEIWSSRLRLDEPRGRLEESSSVAGTSGGAASLAFNAALSVVEYNGGLGISVSDCSADWPEFSNVLCCR